MITKERNSAFELMRILAQFFIIIYHLLYFLDTSVDGEILNRACMIPMHIGVLLYIMISGFFGIKVSVEGFIKLLCITFVYIVPLELIHILLGGGNPRYLFFISNPNYWWFIRTYICLYLISPVLNCFLNKGDKNGLYLLLVLMFISVYIGSMGGDNSLIGGKNIILFSFLYVLGNTIKRYWEYWREYNIYLPVVLFILLNIIECSLYAIYPNHTISFWIWKLGFEYCGPLLIINAILIFLFIGSFQIKSYWINKVAKSTLAVYLLHCHTIFIDYCIIPVLKHIVSFSKSPLFVIGCFLVFSITIFLLCVLIDNMLSPLWKFVSHKGKQVNYYIINKNEKYKL